MGCKVCGASTQLGRNRMPKQRCPAHHHTLVGNAGRYDAAIAALVPIEGQPVDQYELAEMIGCTRAYVSMIEARALRKLRRRAERMGLG